MVSCEYGFPVDVGLTAGGGIGSSRGSSYAESMAQVQTPLRLSLVFPLKIN
jgi:hypothetical protein